MNQNDVKTLKKWINDLIKEDKTQSENSQENEDYAAEEKYDYSVSRLETVLDMIKLIEEA
jgi:hypothetical protein